ncbi:hypothetical protein PIB30_115895, partial [Stylosanthes scabra]|nr:hypothetical protein [Stylosanthes scabra]
MYRTAYTPHMHFGFAPSLSSPTLAAYTPCVNDDLRDLPPLALRADPEDTPSLSMP